jgi:hypothetical protein
VVIAHARLPPGGLRQALWGGCVLAAYQRPDQALANLLERDQMFTDELAGETARTGLRTVHVDGTRTIEDIAGQLAVRLGLRH